jgi:hypothetical protein
MRFVSSSFYAKPLTKSAQGCGHVHIWIAVNLADNSGGWRAVLTASITNHEQFLVRRENPLEFSDRTPDTGSGLFWRARDDADRRINMNVTQGPPGSNQVTSKLGLGIWMMSGVTGQDLGNRTPRPGNALGNGESAIE